MGGHVIHCDEAAYTDPSVIFEIIIPIFEVMDTSVLCISTLVDQDNFYTKFIHMVDENTGYKVCNTCIRTLMCNRCIANGLTTCTHFDKYIPDWKSKKKQGIAKQLFEQHKHLFMRESLGVVSDTEGTVIEGIHIKNFEKKKNFSWKGCPRPKLIFLGFDPNAGGTNDMALIALVNYSGQRLVSFL